MFFYLLFFIIVLYRISVYLYFSLIIEYLFIVLCHNEKALLLSRQSRVFYMALVCELKKKILVIINPISGIGSKRKIPKMIEEAFSPEEYSVEIVFTEYGGHAKALAMKGIEEKVLMIIAVGGDGTVNEVASTLIYSDVILGIIPKGSGNGLARELHIPMDAQKALDIILKGHVSVIDSCTANGRTFFCTCGVGFDAAVSQKFSRQKRRGSLAYVKNTVAEYLSYSPEVYQLQVDDQTVKEEAFLIACGNASQYGNNAYIAPRANIEDGFMDITILSPFEFYDIAPLAIQLFTRQIDKNSKIRTFKAKKAVIIRKKPGVMHLDGEPMMADNVIELKMTPKSLKVYTPEKVSHVKEVRYLFDEVTRFFDKKLPHIFK